MLPENLIQTALDRTEGVPEVETQVDIPAFHADLTEVFRRHHFESELEIPAEELATFVLKSLGQLLASFILRTLGEE